MTDMSLPNVNDIVYVTKNIGPLMRGTEVIVREVSPDSEPYPIVVEPNPTLTGHYLRLDMPLAEGEWSDTPVMGRDSEHISLRERRANYARR